MIKEFQDRVDDLIAQATRSADQLNNVGPGRFERWDEKNGTGPVTAQDTLVKPFDREKAGQAYKTALDAAGEKWTSAKAHVAKLQSEILASLQQTVVVRHRTRLSAAAHAMSRRKAQGTTDIDRLFLKTIASLEEAIG
jgi:hypothetical protein